MGPPWLDSTWVDAVRYPITKWSRKFTDEVVGFEGATFSLAPAGPIIAGWRWKYGASGTTDGYRASQLPELTASVCEPTAGGPPEGINATYQLVYALDRGFFSFPGEHRFTVRHPSACAPLVLYVQLVAGLHPVTAQALLLQRVESDTVWTVASLAADSDPIQNRQRTFIFEDRTSRTISAGTGTHLPDHLGVVNNCKQSFERV
ncbi:hypothetical protein GPECTOR_134g618 [Gonium pectorale]|uniref:Uncharacterized protein n=1 Tax=Gonium pectorale TaxID=33097 RepID=A0A150FY66_GONPE|nr:hypothetical protein GPECTOR_134g618 [Gonium pectorale]|eukprot:KXZ42564.1 hypothetical protein GPECTOR_134g618 [Gonium pectorale]